MTRTDDIAREVTWEGLTFTPDALHLAMLDRIDLLTRQRDTARDEADKYKTLLSLATPPVEELHHRLERAANEWSLVRQDDSPLPGIWSTPEHSDI